MSDPHNKPVLTPDPPLSDGIVTLRPWAPEDAEFIHEACSDPSIRRWLDVPESLEGATRLIETADRIWQRVAREGLPVQGAGHAFAITDAATGQLLGACDMGWHPGTAELGYWVAAPARGKGAATRAVRLLAAWAAELGATRVQITTDALNLHSRLVAARAGFVHEATLRSYGLRHGRRYDLVYYAYFPGQDQAEQDEEYGNPLHAVLTPPRLARFRQATGVGSASLEADVGGWEKLALLAPDRVFLFPRPESGAGVVEREAQALDALGPLCLPDVPRLLGRWEDPDIFPFPFIAVSRLLGVNFARVGRELSLEETAALMDRLGRAIAGWHSLPPDTLPQSFPGRTPWARILDVLHRPDDALLDAFAPYLPRAPAAWAGVWREAVAQVAEMQPVFLHGDVCENQLLVDPHTHEIAGVVDWSGARVGHPLEDLDFGNWGLGIFRFEERFDLLRERLWESYRAVRGEALGDWRVVHLFFCLSEARWLADRLEAGATDRQRRRVPVVMTALAEATRALTA